MLDLTPQVNILAERAHALHARQPRSLIALAGPAGAGKAALADELARRLNAQKCPACVVALDGFLLDNAVLSARGLLACKGAPESYDAEGFAAFAPRLRAPGAVAHPVFDRDRDIALAGAGVVDDDCAVVILEGSYLLFDAAPWRDTAALWDLSVWISPDEADLRARLIHRWLRQNFSRAAATRRAETNDLPNARRVMAAALPADIQL